jgi:hypothetical protein
MHAWRPELAMAQPLQWYEDKADNSPWINALAELRQRAMREGHCYQHVPAITIAIDQYAEKALGNRDYFLNKPYGVGWSSMLLPSLLILPRWRAYSHLSI